MLSIEDIFFDPKYNKEMNRIANILRGMRQRCYNPKCNKYPWYGAKGVTICDEWMDKKYGADNFIEWSIQNGYFPSFTIDRKDPTGNYEPANCRWVSSSYNSSRYATQEEADQDFEYMLRPYRAMYPEWV